MQLATAPVDRCGDTWPAASGFHGRVTSLAGQHASKGLPQGGRRCQRGRHPC